MIRTPTAAPLLFLAIALAAAVAGAGGARAGSWGFEFDNDRFVNTDRHFTHGTRVFWVGDADETPEWSYRLASYLPGLDGPGALQIGVTIGQNMFTPDDITVTSVIENDRPYAGWLYGGVALARVGDGTRQAWELDLGVVGPMSLARQTQIVVHEALQARQPSGWANQLDNEPGVVLVYEQMWQHAWPLADAGPKLALTPHLAGSLGNVYTYAAAGGTVRFGDFPDDDFGPARIRPGVPGSDAIGGAGGSGAGWDFDWYLFAGAEGRYVARNIFLDGNTFSNSHSVDRIPLVLDMQFGVTVALPAVRLTLMHVFRTREFERQPEADRFGVVQAAFRF